MKKYLLVLLIGLAAQVFSQNRDQQYTPPSMQLNQSQNTNGTAINLNMYKANKYKKMEVKGIVLLSVGAVCAGGGAALLVSGINDANNNSSYNLFAPSGPMPKIISGIAFAVVGVVGISLGTPLCIIGAVKSKKEKTQIGVFFSPTGCRVAYTF